MLPFVVKGKISSRASATIHEPLFLENVIAIFYYASRVPFDVLKKGVIIFDQEY